VRRDYAKTASLVVSLGIGLQNFTEGLAIGGSLREGLSSFLLPLVVGLTMQNVTEGFPIVSPFLGREVDRSYLLAMYALGGTPTLLGSLLSYSLGSDLLVVAFNALAMGGILFVALEMYKGLAKGSNKGTRDLAELGIATGIAITFVVNLL
jgi:ZIP family zinc transporter